MDEVSVHTVSISSLLGGAVAGLVVDVSLFPLDTLKTRLQAAKGFVASGGFHGVYKGLGPQVLGSAPQAALFFLTYDTIKYHMEPCLKSAHQPLLHMGAGALAEIVACLIRVPMEVVKQRRQTKQCHSAWRIAQHAYRNHGIRGLYQGFASTVTREVPFSLLQFPLWEYLKRIYRQRLKNNIPLESWEVATCGALAGGVAAALTTPLDVAKTRIMLTDTSCRSRSVELSVKATLSTVYSQHGFKGLFAGFMPRVIWTTVGGYIFFGTYDITKNFCCDMLE